MTVINNIFKKSIKIFHLDEVLSAEDEGFVLECLLERKVIRNIDSTAFEYCRVPSVFPTEGPSGGTTGEYISKMAELFRKHLRRAGLESVGQQAIWIMPKEASIGCLFQMAFFEETGFYPFVIQRWRYENDVWVYGPIRLIDGHGLTRLSR